MKTFQFLGGGVKSRNAFSACFYQLILVLSFKAVEIYHWLENAQHFLKYCMLFAFRSFEVLFWNVLIKREGSMDNDVHISLENEITKNTLQNIYRTVQSTMVYISSLERKIFFSHNINKNKRICRFF